MICVRRTVDPTGKIISVHNLAFCIPQRIWGKLRNFTFNLLGNVIQLPGATEM